MKYEDIAGKPVGEVLGMKVSFVNPMTSRRTKGKISGLMGKRVRISFRRDLVDWVNYDDILEVIE